MREKLKPVLEDGKSARTIDFNEEEQKIVKGLFLLTSKPVLYVANIAEDDMADPDANKYMDAIKEHVAGEGEVIGVSAAAEEQIAEMDEDEKKDFLEMEGVEEPGLNRLIRAAYKLLGLETFFTAGGPETRAWTFKKGTKAPQAAGIIHSASPPGSSPASSGPTTSWAAWAGTSSPSSSAAPSRRMWSEGRPPPSASS